MLDLYNIYYFTTFYYFVAGINSIVTSISCPQRSHFNEPAIWPNEFFLTINLLQDNSGCFTLGP
jgi:hypothetical protein